MKISLFPNPAKDQLTIQTESADAKKTQVINIGGQIISTYEILDKELKLNTEVFIPGVYFYKIRGIDNEVMTFGKFIVAR